MGRSRLVGGRLINTRSKKALLLRGSYIVKPARGETLVRGRPDFFCPLVSTPSSHGSIKNFTHHYHSRYFLPPDLSLLDEDGNEGDIMPICRKVYLIIVIMIMGR